MPIISSDILWKLSTKAGSAGNSGGSTAAASLGKFISTTAWAGAVKNDLFDDISGDENAASAVDYRLVFIHNAHATLTLLGAVVWLASEVAGGASLALSVDATAASAIGSSSAQAKEIANETTAPSSQTFTSPTSKGAGLSLGDIGPGQCRGVWIRRTAANTGAVNDDGGVIQVEGDTTA